MQAVKHNIFAVLAVPALAMPSQAADLTLMDAPVQIYFSPKGGKGVIGNGGGEYFGMAMLKQWGVEWLPR
jgi:hypothetical protein